MSLIAAVTTGGKGRAPSSEPASDWLGLSRLGSPETTPRMPYDSDEETAEVITARENPNAKAKQTTAAATKTEGATKEDTKIVADPDDWLGIGSPNKKISQSLRSSLRSDPDWLGVKDDGKDNKVDDWLGLKDTKTGSADDWLGLKGTKSASRKDTTGDSYLGLGGEVDIDAITG